MGVVVGLATQDLLSNIAAAVSLYSTRPFVTNDHVVLVNQEGVEVSVSDSCASWGYQQPPAARRCAAGRTVTGMAPGASFWLALGLEKARASIAK